MKIGNENMRVARAVTLIGLLFAGNVFGTGANIWQGSTSINWSEGGNWSKGTVPGAGESVTIPAGTTFAPTLTSATAALDSLTLAKGQTLTVMGWESAIQAETIDILGTVTHAANDVTVTNALGGWTPLHRVWLKGVDITVANGGVVNADYLGYPPGAGPGAGAGSGGAGHAGEGRRGFQQDNDPVAPAYGDPAAPWQPGSGGGAHERTRSGGGSIRIEASGVLYLAGELRARGEHAYSYAHGRGSSGGSIWLSCHTLGGTATALVTVDGGNGSHYGAPGSAGRIAVHYDTTAQANLVEPRPPIRFSGKGGLRQHAFVGNVAEVLPAAMGTLYLSDPLLFTGGMLSSKRFQYTRLVIPGFSHCSPAAMTIDNCIIGLPDGFVLNVANDLVLANGAQLHLFAAPVDDVLDDAGAELLVGGDLSLSGNSWIFPYADNTNGATVMIEVGGDMTISANSGINADFLGYTFGEGPGTSAPTISSWGSGGASYGGQGGQGRQGAWGGTPYGNPAGPIQAGSGGGIRLGKAGQGGGAIRLQIGGQAAIDGTLTANGAFGLGYHAPGGSGGGIEVTCQTLTGSGLLSAEGGQGNYYGASGSGGRIAVHYDPVAQAALLQQPAIRFSTFTEPNPTRGESYNFKAEMGTLYLPDAILMATSPTAAARLDGKRFWHTRLLIDDWTAWSPAALTISNCVVAFAEGFQLNVAGDFILGDDAGLNLYAAGTDDLYGARLNIGGDLLIGSGGWLYPHAHGASGAIVGLFVAGNVQIDEGGGINADGKGWFAVSGNKQGTGAGKSGNGAGSYGGKGGGTTAGEIYGLAALPLRPGSPGVYSTGGIYGGSATSGKGGGAIHLIAAGNALIDGILRADGYPGKNDGGACGSGGAIFVALGGGLKGSGTLQARGLSGQGGAGGGGRIAVWTHKSPTEVAQRIAEKNVRGLAYRATISPFTGQLDVTVDESKTNPQAEAGTAGFYATAHSVLLLR